MRDVFIWREMPDCGAPEAGGRRTEPYRQWFYSHWGRENAVISGTDRNVEYTPFRQRLSIKVARGGRERYFIDGRSIAVDDDNYLILNDNRTYGSRFESEVEIESFSVFFRPGLAEEVYGATQHHRRARSRQRRRPRRRRPVEFSESLQPHDSVVTPVLRQRGVRDKRGRRGCRGWYEEQFQFLLERMLANHRRLTERIPAPAGAQGGDAA